MGALDDLKNTTLEGEKPDDKAVQDQNKPETKPEQKKERPKLYDQAPEALRNREDLYQYDTLGKLIEGFDAMKKKADDTEAAVAKAMESLPKFKDEMTAEEEAAIRKYLGVPEKADAYKVPEGFDNFKEAYLEAGLHPRQAAILTKKQQEYAEAQAKAQKEQVAKELAETAIHMKAKYGEKWKEKVDVAEKVAEAIYPKDVIDMMVSIGAFRKSAVLDNLLEIGEKYVKEGRFLDGTSATTQPGDGFDFSKMRAAKK